MVGKWIESEQFHIGWGAEDNQITTPSTASSDYTECEPQTRRWWGTRPHWCFGPKGRGGGYNVKYHRAGTIRVKSEQ